MQRSPFGLAGRTLVLGLFLALVTSCGGGSGGSGGAAATGGIVLMSFEQSGQDNVPLNRVLEFLFSGDVDPASIYVVDAQGKQRSTGGIQIRAGSAFGLTVPGVFEVSGARVVFKPQMPSQCDLSDGGLEANTQYRVSVIGFPEALAVRSIAGKPVDRTTTWEFHTRLDDDPGLLEDQDPGSGPSVVDASPPNGSAAVAIHDDVPSTSAYEGNEVRIRFSESLDPCSVSESTVLIHEFARGTPTTFEDAPNGLKTGFSPAEDQTASPYTWGPSDQPVLPWGSLRIRASITLVQDFGSTEIVVRPEATQWPDNSLIVVELRSEIRDLSGAPLAPGVVSFTTENVPPPQSGTRVLAMDGETSFDIEQTTADVNTARAPSSVQGFMLFAGDGDNGANQLAPTLPTAGPTCTADLQANDGTKDDFDPGTNVVLDTGSTKNVCTNQTDGSTAVVWEFKTFRIRSGITVRVIGVNPAILLVQGDAIIETGGRLQVRGDGQGGAPQGRGTNGTTNSPTPAAGGRGVAGGGDGGGSQGSVGANGGYGQDGTAGFGSPQAGVVGGTGAGKGNIGASGNAYGGTSAAGGGAGHTLNGADGQSGPPPSPAQPPTVFLGTPRGQGGGTYPASGANGLTIDELGHPSAGSGGGAGGIAQDVYSYTSSGGAGGAGGGFLDITAGGRIVVAGTIDCAGSRGGDGGAGTYIGGGGGGGGSGGSVRLLTASEIDLTNGTITTAGGAGGNGANGYGVGPYNAGGAGSLGRIVLEDGDSVVQGLSQAILIPGEGQPGFVRQVFRADRFQGGGLFPEALSDVFYVGSTGPNYEVPVIGDFPEPSQGAGVGLPGVAIPASASRGANKTAITMEARGYPMLQDGEPDLNSPTAFFTIGYFTDSGVPDLPTWNALPWPVADVGPVPADNAGDGIANLDGFPFLQVRFRFFLPTGMGPLDPGPYVNHWILRFSHDQ